jgi:hypothetical protein
MKKILLTLLVSFTFVGVKATTEPKVAEPTFVLEVHYKNQYEINRLNELQNDETFCCIFDIRGSVTNKTESYTEIRHKETGVLLGTFYGTPPSKEFIMEIYKTQLTPEYVNSVVPKILELQKSLTKE